MTADIIASGSLRVFSVPSHILFLFRIRSKIIRPIRVP